MEMSTSRYLSILFLPECHVAELINMPKTKPHSARNKSQPGALTRAPQSLGCAVEAAAAERLPVAGFCAGRAIWKAAREASAEGERADGSSESIRSGRREAGYPRDPPVTGSGPTGTASRRAAHTATP